jgi:hypothetical protein
MRIDSSGNVGIGTTSPSYKLQVYGASNPEMRLGDAVVTYQLYTEGATAAVMGTVGSHALVYRTDATERMRIDSSGNVGIGTSSPSQKLNVSGGSILTDTAGSTASPSLMISSGALGTAGLYAPAANTLGIVVSATERMRIDSAGVITSGLGGMQVISGTAVASTSGTSINFTSIPSWVKKITVMFQGMSTNGTSVVIIQLGTGSTTYTTSGYLGATGSHTTYANFTTGIATTSVRSAVYVNHGAITITNITGNSWVASGTIGNSESTVISYTGSSIALAAVLTAVRVTTVNGTDAFDAGTINILYE